MLTTSSEITPTTFTKINLGCGFDRRDGYVNVDLNDFHAPDLVADISDLKDFPSNFYEEVLAQDVLEHMTREKSKVAFSEWARLLSPTGVLKVRVPSLIGLLTLLHKHPWTVEAHNHIVHLTFGTQAYNGDFHLTGFTPPILLSWATDAGLMVTSAAVRDDWLFDIEFAKIRMPTNAEYVHQLYFEILGRPADQEGLQAYLGFLNSGKSREELHSILINSTEAKALPK